MSLQIELYTSEEQAASARAFNQRLRGRGQTEFLLGESPPSLGSESPVIYNRYYLALENGTARGGFLLASYPAAFGVGSECDVLNCREPLSESIIDGRQSFLSLQLLKFMQEQGPYLFALGMGSENRPFPRLLKSAGWTLRPVPFLFRVLSARPFLRELRILQSSPLRRALANVAATLGVGNIVINALQFRFALPTQIGRGVSIEPVVSWDHWVDELWDQYRGDCSFAVLRDLRTVRALYPLGGRIRAYLFRQSGRPVGWVAAVSSSMRDDKHFGNLRVATILDGIALQGAKLACVALASRELAREGVELLLANHSHLEWGRAFRAAGYHSAASNYILALSKQLSANITSQPNGLERMHFTRGDSDGRGHL